MALTSDPWILSVLTGLHRRYGCPRPRAQLIHIYPNSDVSANSTLKMSESSCEPVLVLLSDKKHTVKAIITEEGMKSVGTSLDVKKSSLLGGVVMLLKYRVYANLTVESELEREMILIIDELRYLTGECKRVESRDLVASWTVEEVRQRLAGMVGMGGESETSMLKTPGEMTQLLLHCDSTMQSEDVCETDGMFASVSALRRIVDQVRESGGCHGDEDPDIATSQAIDFIPDNQEQEINTILKQLLEQSGGDDKRGDRQMTDKENDIETPHRECETCYEATGLDQTERLTEDKENGREGTREKENCEEDTSFLMCDEPLPARILPSQLVDNFSKNEEILEVVPVTTDYLFVPDIQPIIIDIETINDNNQSPTDITNKVRTDERLDSEETVANSIEQSSDTTALSGGSAGRDANNQVEQTNQIHTNKSIFGFSLSALPSGIVPSNGIPCNQQDEVVITINNSGDKPEQQNSQNASDNTTIDDSRDVVSPQDGIEAAPVNVTPSRVSPRSRHERRKRRWSSPESSPISIYPKRFLALKLKRVQTDRRPFSNIMHRAPSEEERNSDLYQFCMHYWKAKTDAPLVSNLH